MKNRTIVINPGDRFGKLTVVKELPTRRRPPRTYDRMFLCSCDCGNEAIVAMSGLRGGSTKSCGCLKKEGGKIKNDDNGNPDTRLKRIWYGMKTRCKGRREKEFRNYASRNIKVCDEWANDFNVFKNWALSHGYSPLLTIDRIDGNKGYSPENCRWATVKQQLNNTRVNHRITCRNETHTISEWAKILGVNSGAIYRRIYKGWSAEDALFVPKQRGVDYKDRVGKEELISLVNMAINSGLCKNKNDYIEKVGISRTSFFHTIKGGIMSKENTSRVRNFNKEAKK